MDLKRDCKWCPVIFVKREKNFFLNMSLLFLCLHPFFSLLFVRLFFQFQNQDVWWFCFVYRSFLLILCSMTLAVSTLAELQCKIVIVAVVRFLAVWYLSCHTFDFLFFPLSFLCASSFDLFLISSSSLDSFKRLFRSRKRFEVRQSLHCIQTKTRGEEEEENEHKMESNEQKLQAHIHTQYAC